MSLVRFLHFEVLGFLFLLAAVVVFQIATGRINMAGIITRKDGTYQTSPERVQLLLATIAACSSYLGEVARTTTGNLPDVSNNLLYLMGGSSGLYILRKGWAFYNVNKRA
jgi:hypothetical protein